MDRICVEDLSFPQTVFWQRRKHIKYFIRCSQQCASFSSTNNWGTIFQSLKTQSPYFSVAVWIWIYRKISMFWIRWGNLVIPIAQSNLAALLGYRTYFQCFATTCKKCTKLLTATTLLKCTKLQARWRYISYTFCLLYRARHEILRTFIIIKYSPNDRQWHFPFSFFIYPNTGPTTSKNLPLYKCTHTLLLSRH